MTEKNTEVIITDYKTHVYAYSPDLDWGRKIYGSKSISFDQLKELYDEHIAWKKALEEFKSICRNID